MARTLLGFLTPSSNTILEPVTSEMVGNLSDVTAHFGRFGVTEISMASDSMAQFQLDKPLAAAHLLADARVQAIVWSGTSASWLGFDNDEALCATITDATGIAAGSAVLAINDLFTQLAVRRFALVSPYIDSIQERIIANYARNGWDCVAEEHLGEHRNFEFSEVTESQIDNLIRRCATNNPDAIVIMCTNMRGARVATTLEAELGIPIIDSTAAAVWKAMQLATANPARITGWGRIFASEQR